MKFVNYVKSHLVVGIFILIAAAPLYGADEVPTVTTPAQTTPPEVGTELEVPPAVPLDALPQTSPEVPSVGAKKANGIRVPASEAAPTEAVEEEVTVSETQQVVTPPPEAKTAVPAEIPTEAARATQPAAPAPRTVTEAEALLRQVEETEPLPSGRAQPVVSTEMRPADKKTVEEAEKKREEEGVYFNVAGEDIREIIKQISRVTGTNFLLDDKIRGEVTIISEKKLTPDEVYEAFLSALDVAGYTTVPGPAGLTKIVKKRDALSSPIPIYTEKTPYSDRMITRLVTLKNISANDMANAIKGLVSKEGNLFAYPATNTLILTDTGTNIDRIVRLVQELDTEGPQEVLEIIPIEYADVSDIAEKITQLFGEGGQAPTTRARTTRRRRGQEAATPTEVPALNKVIPDERTNSIIIMASKITIAKVRDIIRRLDRPLVGPEEGQIHVLYLKNAKASEMAEVLSGVTEAAKRGAEEEQREQQRGARQPAVPQQQFEGLFGSIKSIRADDQTNALIIQANAKDFKTLIDRIITKLDIPRRQVYVEATIMEVNAAKDADFGVGIIGGKVFSAGGDDLALFGNTFPFIPDITTTSSAGGVTTANPIDVQPPFSSDTVSFPRFFAAIVAQQGDTQLNVLSTPNILTLDNQEARIKVGDTIPFLTGNALTTGGVSTSNIQREDVALELSVTPQITEGDNVRMKIKQVVEDFSQTAPNPLEASAGPATSIREIESEVVVPDNRTVVLGGLMQDKDASGVTKVPLLGDIPILGWLFKSKTLTKRKVNLLIFLTPSIIREPSDFMVMMRRKIEQRNRFIDEQYGERARKRIRDTIKTHNEKLLEFQVAGTQLSEPDLLAEEGVAGGPLEVPGETPAQVSEPQATQEAIDASLSEQGEYPPDLAIDSEPPSIQEQYGASPPSAPQAQASQPQAPQGAMPGDIDLAF